MPESVAGEWVEKKVGISLLINRKEVKKNYIKKRRSISSEHTKTGTSEKYIKEIDKTLYHVKVYM